MRCLACGRENQHDRRLCAACGTPMGVPCAACGFATDPAANFCGGCGIRLPRRELREPAPRAWPMAERRQLTLLFCDLCQSTALSDRLDPEDMREVLDHYRSRCAVVLERYRGTVAYYMGDGILAYFGYPTAHEDDAVRAVRAALEIVPAIMSLGRDWQPPLPLPLQVRIAVHTGLVVAGEIGIDQRRSELWAVGKAPNVAARLQLLAAPDTIVISDATQRLLHGVFTLTSLGRHELAGIGDTIEAFRVESEQPVATVVTLDAAQQAVPLVNREAEFAFLEQCWEGVQEGKGKAILVSGEPGIGKSRLIRALVSGLRASEHRVLLFQSSPYYLDSPLHPVIEHVERAAAIGTADSGERRLERLERLVGTLRERVPDLVEVLADLLGIAQDRYGALAALAPAEKRLRTLETLCDYMLHLAREQPAILIFEDLHWADPTTREWLGQLFARVGDAPLLGLIALRSDFQPSWAVEAGIEHLRLDRLSRDHSAAILDSLTGASSLSAELRERILGATDGVPLFVEELTRALVEAESAPVRGRSGDGAAHLIAIPTTIQDSLTARLDRLGGAKQVAQTAAVIGRDFSRDLLVEVADLTAGDLRAALARLVESGLVLSLGASDEHYAFKHALVRDAAYDGLLLKARRALHGRIVDALESRFPAIIAANPELVAQHAAEARLYEKAVHYWLLAGRQAVARSAHTEAVSHLERALHALHKLPDTASFAVKRLECLVTLGPSLILIEGPGAPRVEVIYSEAVQLCERVEPSLDHVAAFWGWWRICQSYDVMRDRAERLLALANRLAAPAVVLQAHHCMWATRLEMADFPGTCQHVALGLAVYEQGDYAAQADYFGGHDAKVCGSGSATFAFWHLGEVERALRLCQDGLEWAGRLGHAGSILHALDIAVTFRRYRREPTIARHLAERMIEFGRERGLNDHLAKGELYLGWTLGAAGQLERGIEMVEKAFAVERATGTPEDFPIYSDLLAEMLVQAGRAGSALEEIERGLAESEAASRRIWLPELHRRRGEVLLALKRPRVEEAEACFSEALTIARNQSARSLELRAACSLARLWRRRHRVDEARHLLRDVYAGFREGFETVDLREARRELDALGVEPMRAPASDLARE